MMRDCCLQDLEVQAAYRVLQALWTRDYKVIGANTLGNC